MLNRILQVVRYGSVSDRKYFSTGGFSAAFKIEQYPLYNNRLSIIRQTLVDIEDVGTIIPLPYPTQATSRSPPILGLISNLMKHLFPFNRFICFPFIPGVISPTFPIAETQFTKFSSFMMIKEFARLVHSIFSLYSEHTFHLQFLIFNGFVRIY